MAKAVQCLLSIRINAFGKACFKSTSALVEMETNNTNQKTYQEAIAQLNKLQSNIQVLNSAREDRNKTAQESLPWTRHSLRGIGMELEELDTLNIIHVAGSKGKGMTCAFTESMLRQAGLRTGFFSSPHLLAARERIRINGKPLTEQKFAQYFFTTFNKLNSVTENKDLPGYFRFLTCMAFYVFLKEKVDVAVVEVGIGGLYDSTNIIRKPIVVGITSLGLEHQFILGNTLEEIAANKAGIMKESVPAFTIHTHPPHILQVLKERSLAYKCPLQVAPPLEAYSQKIQLGVDDGVVSRINASLAIQLASSFLKTKFPHLLHDNADQNGLSAIRGNELNTKLSPLHLSGLKHAKWHGRFQTVSVNNNLTYFVDGAHTADSLTVALNWFVSQTTENSFCVLIFHLTGDRKAEDLIKPFVNCGKFNLAIFCPLVISNPYSTNAGSVDNWSALGADEDSKQKCDKHKKLWLNFSENSSKALVFSNVDSSLKFLEKLSIGELDSDHNDNLDMSVALDNPEGNLGAISKGKKVNVLITGSLHLVGTFLSVLDPELK